MHVSFEVASPRCDHIGITYDTLPAMRLMEVIARLNGGLGTPSSWRSTDTPDDNTASLSPTSCSTTLSDPGDTGDLSFTIGITENTPYACHFCEKAFPRLSYLKRHEQVHSDQMPFKCDFCQRLFKHKRSRDRHIKLHTGDRKYRCSHCDAAFSRSDHLKIHMKTHDNAKPYQCTVCNRGYNTAAALTSHMQNHKRDASTNNTSNSSSPYQHFRCLQCSGAFATAKDLQEHVSTHGGNSTSNLEKRASTYNCNICGEVFNTAQSLQQHEIQRHATDSQSQCSICREQFPNPEALYLHKRVHQDSSSPSKEEEKTLTRFGCGFCTKAEFPTLDSLQLHMQQCHLPLNTTTNSDATLNIPILSSCDSPKQDSLLRITPGDYNCEHCTMKFSNLQNLQKHCLTVHSFAEMTDNRSKPLHCHLCKKSFSSLSSIAEHVRFKHGRNVGDGAMSTSPKDSIDKKLQQPGSLGSSPRQHSIPDVPAINGGTPHFPVAGTLLCSQCNAAFPDFESFRTHLKSHLDAVVKKFNCSECEGEFPTEEMLDVHVANHYLSMTVEYGCQCCLKTFGKPDQLQKHLMDIHAHQLFRCALCKEMFDSKVSVQVHFAVKHSNECHLYKCTSCSAIFRSDLEFQMHVKVAHLAKLHPFRCLLCDMCFPTEIHLQLHLHGHKKQFSCPFCKEAFHVEFLLDKHMEEKHAGETNIPQYDLIQNLSVKSMSKGDLENNFSHHGEYQYHCEICDARFTSDSSLNMHRKQVHNIRTTGSQKPGHATLSLFCAYCNESCKSRTDLENHMKAHIVSPTKHKCNICDEVCPSAGTLAEHKLSHCKIVAGSTCVSCHTLLKTEDQFYSHLQQHNTQGLPAPCVVCRQTLMLDVEVQVHSRYHLKKTEAFFSCCVCAQPNPSQQLIITGKQDSHSYMCKDCFHAKGNGLRCTECHVKFENVLELDKHRSIHRKTYQCIKCQMSFETEGEIQMHVTTHVLKEGTNHGCHLCPDVFDSPAKLQCHLIEHTFNGCSAYTCYMCSSTFTVPHLIQQHMLEHGLDSKPFDCRLCHQKFFFRTELENHTFNHKETSLQSCTPDFPELFSSPTSSHELIKTHEPKQNNFKCSVCPEVFETSTDMQQHYFRVHCDGETEDDKNCYPCSVCDKRFPCLSNLQGHLRVHNQGAKYKCSECDKEFALSRNLNIHMRTHSGEKPYECPICKKRFTRKENRKAHLKSHSGQKPFMCPHCGKTFSRKCHVKEHMRVHITSTTHPCELCTETFASIADLRHHLSEIHQKQFDHVCSVCNEIFEHAEDLDHHMSSDHEVRTTNSREDSSPMEEISSETSSLERSSTSVEMRDVEFGESNSCSSSINEESESSMSIIDAAVTMPAVST